MIIKTAKLTLPALVLLFAGCGLVKEKQGGGGGGEDPVDDVLPQDDDSDDEDVKHQGSPLGLTGELEHLKDCKEVEAHIEARLIADMERELDWQLRWADDMGKGVVAQDAANDSASEMGSGEQPAAAAATPDDFTTTNNQVDGVEEADFVKNTGTHIFHVSNGTLRILKSWPADAMALVSETKLDGRPFEMLLEGENRLVVFSHPRGDAVEGGESTKPSGGAVASDAVAEPGYSYMNWDWEKTEISVFDVSDPAKPRRQAVYRLKGSYLSSRRVGSSVRVVMQSYRPYPEDVVTWLDYSPYYKEDGTFEAPDKGVLRAKISALKEKNRAIIEGKSLAYWLDADAYVKVDSKGKTTSLLDVKVCKNVYSPTTDTQLGMTRIATLDLDSGSLAETLLLSYTSEIYASEKSLFLTTPYWWWDSEARDTDFTWIHKFGLSDAQEAPYEGSGGVEGMLINQFAMDEFDGNLRVATTVTKIGKSPCGEGEPCEVFVGPGETVNRVSVLGPKGGKLKLLGQTKDLAKGERIFAVRFQGPRGYVVTFRQVDPLYTLDLADASAPAVVGKLKIPGFSSYLHFIDDTHLLAIGMAGDENGGITGMKLSIFDVSDLKAPKESHKLDLEGSAWTEAQYNHKAFTFFRSKGLLALPMTGYRENAPGSEWWDHWYSSLGVFKVDIETGITQLGEVDASDMYTGDERTRDWWFSGATVRRSIFASDGDDTYVYTIADLGIRSTDVSALDVPLATVGFTCDAACYGAWWWWY